MHHRQFLRSSQREKRDTPVQRGEKACKPCAESGMLELRQGGKKEELALTPGNYFTVIGFATWIYRMIIFIIIIIIIIVRVLVQNARVHDRSW